MLGYEFIDIAGRILDVCGVVVILGGVLYATFRLFNGSFKEVSRHTLYNGFRQDMSKGVVLGLEFLVAGDLIRTVAGNPTLNSVAVLAVLVVIRTFMAISFQVEIDGKWPWRRG